MAQTKRNKHGLAKYAKRIKKLEADLEVANARILALEARWPFFVQLPALPAMPTPIPHFNGDLPQPYTITSSAQAQRLADASTVKVQQ